MSLLKLMPCRATWAAALFAAVATDLAPAVAQETQYRVGLVTPEVVCRVEPAHSADAVGLLKVVGSGRAVGILVQRTETDESGETWIHVAARHTPRPWDSDGCWIPESVVARTDGAGHLLRLADGLLSAAAWPPLDQLVAVHNLFVQSGYRQQVEQSAVLNQRRTALLAKALEAAQRTQLGGSDLVYGPPGSAVLNPDNHSAASASPPKVNR